MDLSSDIFPNTLRPCPTLARRGNPDTDVEVSSDHAGRVLIRIRCLLLSFDMGSSHGILATQFSSYLEEERIPD
ncbi:hypothetical protein Y032_0481g2259 [Ancylostoma ceylanicum]|uniref:Uncharacterized protein n=1 Tax=Ancylostoma ceylanicum TaxID=53326 RepID=A0A016WVS6_9BILA|nr:hypothetical protein Y032_0481g2259 [Ancylostoma ceylanicum]